MTYGAGWAGRAGGASEKRRPPATI